VNCERMGGGSEVVKAKNKCLHYILELLIKFSKEEVRPLSCSSLSNDAPFSLYFSPIKTMRRVLGEGSEFPPSKKHSYSMNEVE